MSEVFSSAMASGRVNRRRLVTTCQHLGDIGTNQIKEEKKCYRQIREHRGKFCTWGGFRRYIYMQLFSRTIVNLIYVIHSQECSGRFATFTSDS